MTVESERLQKMNGVSHRLQLVALVVILTLATFLHFFRLDQEGFANLYYAATVKSMLTSWHNFFYAAFDPGGFVSVDKPPLGFWVQALSATLFGFNGFALLLPQAFAGVLAVALLYRLVARVFGVWAGIIAALVLTVTPISIAANRNNTIDSQLVLTSLLAAWAVSIATERGQLRWLIICAILVGIGFNIKMLQAYLVLPAFWLTYLVVARTRWYSRVAHLALATLVLIIVSLAWIAIFDATPAEARPYAGSSRNNSMMELVVGHNGITRLGAIANALGLRAITPRATQPSFPQNPPPPPNTPPYPPTIPPPPQPNVPRGPGNEVGAPGILRLFNQQLAGQISWLLPLALSSILVLALEALALYVSRVDVQGSRFEVQGYTIRNTHYVSRIAYHILRIIPHASFDCATLRSGCVTSHASRITALVLWSLWLLPQIIFFSFAGLFHRYYLEMMAPAIAVLVGAGIVTLWRAYEQHRWRGLVLPFALLLTALVQVAILTYFPDWGKWLAPLVLGISLLTTLVLVALKFTPALRSLRLFITTLGILALLIAPAVWSLTPLANADTALPFAGPELLTRAPRPPTPSRDRIVDFLLTNRHGERFLVATSNATTAAPIILATGEPVMALGGFSGGDRILTVNQLATRVTSGTVRFFLITDDWQQQPELLHWIRTRCTLILSAPRAPNPVPGRQQLYDCKRN